jgi:hypothetical protein
MSQRTDSVQAGGETARMARDNLAKDDSMAWALVFSGGRHYQEDIIQGLRSQLGETVEDASWTT